MPHRSKMSLAQLTLLTTISMMGSSIALLPTELAQVGTISILSWLVTAVGSMCLAYAFAKCGLFSKKQGMGGYSEYAFGKSGHFMANYTYAVSLLFANIAIAITCVGYGATLFDVELSTVETCCWTLVVIWLCSMLSFLGARITGNIRGVAVWCVIAPVVTLSVIGWWWFDPDMYVASWNPHNEPFTSAVSSSISMTLWCFLGLESACVNCDNVDNPERNVPIAVMTATCTVAVICIASTNIIAGIIPNAELAASNAPFGLVFARMFAPEAGHIVTAMLVFSCLGSTLSWQYTIAKVFQLSAREGFFPSVFSKVNRWGFPAVGLIIITLIQTGFTFMTASPSLLKQFNMLVDLAVVTNLIPFILSMAAIPMIMKMANVPVAQTRKYTFFGLIGAIYSFYAISSLGYVEMFWGSMATFVGWTFWGFLSTKYADEHPIHLLRDSQFEDID